MIGCGGSGGDSDEPILDAEGRVIVANLPQLKGLTQNYQLAYSFAGKDDPLNQGTPEYVSQIEVGPDGTVYLVKGSTLAQSVGPPLATVYSDYGNSGSSVGRIYASTKFESPDVYGIIQVSNMDGNLYTVFPFGPDPSRPNAFRVTKLDSQAKPISTIPLPLEGKHAASGLLAMLVDSQENVYLLNQRQRAVFLRGDELFSEYYATLIKVADDTSIIEKEVAKGETQYGGDYFNPSDFGGIAFDLQNRIVHLDRQSRAEFWRQQGVFAVYDPATLEKVQEVRFDGYPSRTVSRLRIDRLGNFYFIDQFSTYSYLPTNPYLPTPCYVRKFAPDGRKLAAFKVAESSLDCSDFAVDGNENVYVAGNAGVRVYSPVRSR